MDMKNPECIGIILDGNRRWAKHNGLPTLEGHRRGYERVMECARWVRDRGIPHLVVYAFSTENWNRDEAEVSYLMDLIREMAHEGLSKLAEEQVRIRFIGKLDMLPHNVREVVERVEDESKENTKFTVWACLSYGGRAEIVAAARKLAKRGEEITEKSLREHFWSAEMPDPDLIIRPGGEKRLSNFLLWQAAYSELFFLEPYWPDFTEALLNGVLADYAHRTRRIGT